MNITSDGGVLSVNARRNARIAVDARRATQYLRQTRDVNKMARRLRNPELVTRLIEEIESRPCLWQVNHPYYHNRKKMNAAWQEISEKLDIPGNVILK